MSKHSPLPATTITALQSRIKPQLDQLLSQVAAPINFPPLVLPAPARTPPRVSSSLPLVPKPPEPHPATPTIALGVRALSTAQVPEIIDVHLTSLLSSTYILGRSGYGKTTLILSLLDQHLRSGHGFIVLDPHGDLIKDTLILARLAGREDITLLDLTDYDHPFGLNIFACPDSANPLAIKRTAECVVAIFKRLWSDSWGARLEDLLSNVVITLVENPGTTLNEIAPLLHDSSYRAHLVANLHNQEVKAYWEEVFNHFSAANRLQITEPLLNKVRAYLRDPLIRNIVCQKENTVDLSQVIAEKSVVLVKLNTDLPEATKLIGSMFLQQTFGAIMARGSLLFSQRHPYFLYADEFHNFSNSLFGKLVAESRKMGLGTTMCHQYQDQLPVDERSAPLGSGTHIYFQLIPDDARRLSIQVNPEKLSTSLPFATSLPITNPLDLMLRSGHPSFDLLSKAHAIDRLLHRELAARRLGWRASAATDHVRLLREEVDRYLHARMRHEPPSLATIEHLLAEGIYLGDQERTRHGQLLSLLAQLGNALADAPLFQDGAGVDVAKLLRELPKLQAIAHYPTDNGMADTLLTIVRPNLAGAPLALQPAGRHRALVEAEIAQRRQHPDQLQPPTGRHPYGNGHGQAIPEEAYRHVPPLRLETPLDEEE